MVETEHREKLILQKKENQFLCERPDDWLGGGGEVEDTSHLRHPRSKLKSTWLQDEGKSQSLKDLALGKPPKKVHNEDPLHASESHFFKNDHEILTLQKKQNQFLTERPSDWLGGCGDTEEAPTSTHKTKLKTSWQQDGKGNNEPAEEVSAAEATPKSHAKPKAQEKHEDEVGAKETKLPHKNQEKIVLQKKKNQYLCARPDDWLGGCGEIEDTSHLRQPRSKLRSSWMGHDEGMSQSLRDLSLDDSKHQDDDPLNASESHAFLGKKEKRKTSPMILAKLSAFAQQNEENHKKNEEFEKAGHGASHYQNEPNSKLIPPLAGEDGSQSLRGLLDPSGQLRKSSPETHRKNDELSTHKEYSNTHAKPMRHNAIRPETNPLVAE